MIIDHLRNADRYCPLHPGFAAGFAFLRREDLASLAEGRYDIDGDRVFAVVARAAGRGHEQSPLEIHRRYIDIQFTIGGEDRIGWMPASDCRQVASPFDEKQDFGFFDDQPASWFAVAPGIFAVFYPKDAHAPLATSGLVHKVVVKVAVEA